ncbi:DUF7218 family protein [Mycolicibacterium arenosum]|uniref:Rho termination factor N-terminal domain-containing protein n=1 Tax=Mycolicibacterium arenosum TaxID=2952157 RepID=A0ABT1LY87_9MYCO|nr:Rho termination factor N-terminal domain-containing protein [Mycolicibacterium sp. CAU 1645]MCP9271870.1 Rho termination factor N-terminal domain-containing protein [Mycolicibacterium sp. CAU 1645]
MPNASIKDDVMYDELRDQGDSKEKAASISNAAASRGRSRIGRRGGRSGPYDTWTVLELRERARELGLTGYSSLSKSDLIFELRNH